MLGPQSRRNVAPGTSVRYALWNRPPAPNASPDPRTVTRMTRCGTESVLLDRAAGCGARATAGPPLWRASTAIHPVYVSVQALTRGVVASINAVRRPRHPHREAPAAPPAPAPR